MHRALKPRAPRQSIGIPIFQLLGLKAVKGDIGIELEFEGNKFKREQIPSAWIYHKDGSLRGEDNAEYVLRKPVNFKDVPKHVEAIYADMAAFGTVLSESNRTSVHVHLNCQQFYMNRLTSLIALYTVFEEILAEWCGEHRVGNLFCMRGIDAPGTLKYLQRFIERDGNGALPDNLHYAAMNPQALFKFGSLEFRTMRGAPDAATALQWVGILERLYNLSADYPDPREICGRLSSSGPLGFFDEVFGEHGPVLRAGTGWADDSIREAVYRGIRLVQGLCYCRDWSQFKGLTIAPDPFGRSDKKAAYRVMQFAGGEQAQAVPAPLQYNPVQYTQALQAYVETDDPEYQLEEEEEIDDEFFDEDD